MRLGTRSGCHQMPERSFHIRGYQFPVCARCTGLFMGQLAGIITGLLFSGVNLYFLITCAVISTALLAVDGIGQRFGKWVSNNRRRFSTGLLCGIFVLWAIVKTTWYS
ncbi:MAG: DUF2085 domain-containing protein [Clostridia bacterium]|nr:DUF2085 domain-containing protein [Clostridia bacterium]